MAQSNDIVASFATQNIGYIGSKSKLSQSILNSIALYTNKSIKNTIIGDLFSGSGQMSKIFKQNGMNVIANDTESYSYFILSANLNSGYTKNIENIIETINLKINNLKNITDKNNGLIYLNYCEKGIDNRKFFIPDNANKIDISRKHIETLYKTKNITLNEYNFLVASVITSADKVANTSAVYGAYLKQYKASANKNFVLLPIHQENKKETIDKHIIYKNDIMDIYTNDNYDIVYLDPPYNNRQYSKNYHVLNVIANYDSDVEIYGKTGLLKNSFVSDFCKKSTITALFDNLFKNLKTKYIFLSYNNEGLISKEEITKIIKKYCKNYTINELDYKRFKSNKINEANQNKEVIEYLFCCEK